MIWIIPQFSIESALMPPAPLIQFYLVFQKVSKILT
jgi:hypothetical protein